jgi:antirestriction protein ArdC
MESNVPSEARFDVHRAITDKIVEAIERGAGEFVMPWHRGGPGIGRPTNASTRQKYRGVNVVALWGEASLVGYGSGTWASFRQWQKLGAQVRKGEHGTVIVFYKRFDAEARGEDEEEKAGPRMFARASRVFNAEQVTGYTEPLPAAPAPVDVLPEVEAVVEGTKAAIVHGGSRAYYDRAADRIHIPDRHRFLGTPTSSPTESFCATVLHELTHWSGAGHRLNRQFGERFGDDAYAFEELVAELGAAFLCGDLRIANDPRPDHAAYLASWLSVLKRDRQAIFAAARLATAAADYITGLSVPF